MFRLLMGYMLKSLVQRKGKNILWINAVNSMIDGAISGANFTKKQIFLWKHILTASREGSEKVRMKHYLNMFLKLIAVGAYALLWLFLSKWFFGSFDPFSYMDVNGDFWEAILVVGFPMMLYAFLCGQLDWFGSSDAYESETLVSESLPFKWLISLEAGVTEELSHRALLIFFGLISVYLSNLFFSWIIAFIIVVICVVILMSLEIKLIISGPLMLGVLFLLTKLSGYVLENPIHVLNSFIFDSLKWVTMTNLRITIFMSVLMSIAILMTLATRREKNASYDMSIAEFVTRIVMFTIWGAYCMPLGIEAIGGNMPFLPAEPDKWTYLLYVGAILWSNAKFRDGHKYQGPAGMMNSYVIGLYMFYIAFTHGLLYAIVLHVMFDAVLLSSEHFCQVIKNRRMAFKVI